jgi:phytoene synthase
MTPDQYCQDKAAKSGSSFYYSFLFLPPQQRRAIISLYAFCREVDDVVDETEEHEIARIKLAWWREEVAKVFEDKAEHMVGKALQQTIKDSDLSQEHFIEIIDGMEMDLDYNAYPTFKELSLYCYRVASVVGLMSAEIFGYDDRKTLKYAHALGMAFQLTNILRDIHEDSVRGRLYIPLDELERFGVTTDELMENKTTDNIRALLKFQAERAQNYYNEAFELLPDCDRHPQRSGLIMSTIYRTILDEIEKDGYRVLEHRTSLTPIRKLWLAWRTFRKEKKRYKAFLKNVAAA